MSYKVGDELDIDYSLQHHLVNGGVVLGLMQYRNYLKTTHANPKELAKLDDFISDIKENINR